MRISITLPADTARLYEDALARFCKVRPTTSQFASFLIERGIRTLYEDDQRERMKAVARELKTRQNSKT